MAEKEKITVDQIVEKIKVHKGKNWSNEEIEFYRNNSEEIEKKLKEEMKDLDEIIKPIDLVQVKNARGLAQSVPNVSIKQAMTLIPMGLNMKYFQFDRIKDGTYHREVSEDELAKLEWQIGMLESTVDQIIGPDVLKFGGDENNAMWPIIAWHQKLMNKFSPGSKIIETQEELAEQAEQLKLSFEEKEKYTNLEGGETFERYKPKWENRSIEKLAEKFGFQDEWTSLVLELIQDYLWEGKREELVVVLSKHFLSTWDYAKIQNFIAAAKKMMEFKELKVPKRLRNELLKLLSEGNRKEAIVKLEKEFYPVYKDTIYIDVDWKPVIGHRILNYLKDQYNIKEPKPVK